MKNVISTFSIILLLNSCTHQPKGYIRKTFFAKKCLIDFSNFNDTITLGDTIFIKYNLPNPIECTDGSFIDVSNSIAASAGFEFTKSPNGTDTNFGYPDDGFYRNNSTIDSPGGSYFKYLPRYKYIADSTIGYLPSDTGTYVFKTLRDQYVTCTIPSEKGPINVAFDPQLNTNDIHAYLMDNYPVWKKIYFEQSIETNIRNYYFYVKK